MAAEPKNIDQWEPREDLSLQVQEIDTVMQREGYIMSRIMPAMAKSSISGKVPVMNREEAMQRYDCRKAPGSDYLRLTMKFGKDTYDTDPYGLELPIDDYTLARFDDIIDIEAALNELAEYVITTQWEDEGIKMLTDPAAVDHPFAGSRTTAVAIPWTDHLNAKPIDDVLEGRKRMRAQYGRDTARMAIDSDQLLHLSRCAQIIELSKGQSFQDVRGRSIANVQPIATALNLEEIIVQKSVELNKESETDNYKRMWPLDKALLLAPDEDRNGIIRALGRQIVWDRMGTTDGERIGIESRSYYEDQTNNDVIQRTAHMRRKIWHADAGHLLTDLA